MGKKSKQQQQKQEEGGVKMAPQDAGEGIKMSQQETQKAPEEVKENPATNAKMEEMKQ